MVVTTRSKLRVHVIALPQTSIAALICALLGSGCSDATSPSPEATVSGGTTQASPTTSTTAFPATTQGTDSTTGATDTEGADETAVVPPPPFPDFPPPSPKYCGLEDIDVTTDPATAVDAGDEPGQLPLAIGDALLRNCGCHYTDNVEGLVDYMSDAVPIATHADFHAPFEGVFPQAFDGLVYEAVELRVVFVDPLPMPPIECDVIGENGMITEADLALFADWLSAGAPDAPNYLQE